MIELVRDIELRLNIIDPSNDWYKVSQAQLEDLGLLYLVRESGGLRPLLTVAYPNIQWNQELLDARTKQSEQHSLRNTVSALRLQKEK